MSLPAKRFQVINNIPGGYLWERALREKNPYCSICAVKNSHTGKKWPFFTWEEARKFAEKANTVLSNTWKEPVVEELLEPYTLFAKGAPGLDVMELRRHNLPLHITLYRCRE